MVTAPAPVEVAMTGTRGCGGKEPKAVDVGRKEETTREKEVVGVFLV